MIATLKTKSMVILIVIVLNGSTIFCCGAGGGIQGMGDPDATGDGGIVLDGSADDVSARDAGAGPDATVPRCLRASGTTIVDAEGAEISLRGFQGLAAYSIPDDLFIKAVIDDGKDPYLFDPIAEDILQYSITDFDFDEITSTGANVVRIWTRVYEILRGSDDFSEAALAMLEDTINRFGGRGIYTVLVMAGAGENNYEPQQCYLDRGINLWDPASTARNDSIAAWGALSKRLSANPHVAGYDVMNEPMPPTEKALRDYYLDVIDEIRRYDRCHMIILPVAQGNEAAFQIGGEYSDDNIAATAHFYHPHDFTLEPGIPNQTYPGTYGTKYWDRDALEEVFAAAIHLPQLKDRPLYVGEFGAGGERDGNGGLEWTRDVLEIMNRLGLHYTYHNYKHKVHRGYWTKTEAAREASSEVFGAIVDGTMKYEDVTEEQKRNMFMTEYSCTRRDGISEILTGAFTSSR